MKKLAFAGMLLALLIASRPATSAVTIDFAEGDHTVAVGTPFTVTVRISGDSGSLDPALHSFDIEIGFSRSHMAFDDVGFGDPLLGDQLDFDGLSDKSVVGPFDSGVDLSFVRIAETSNDLMVPMQPGVFVLATLTFHALASGPTQIGVYEATLDGYDGGFPEVFIGASTITAVPEPISLLWAVAALGLIAEEESLRTAGHAEPLESKIATTNGVVLSHGGLGKLRTQRSSHFRTMRRHRNPQHNACCRGGCAAARSSSIEKGEHQ